MCHNGVKGAGFSGCEKKLKNFLKK